MSRIRVAHDDGTSSDKDTDDEAEEAEMMYHQEHEASPQFVFPKDIYSLAMIMFMSARSPNAARNWKAVWPLILCLACGVSQYTMCVAGQRHVVDNVENRLWDPVTLALWELSHMNRTMESSEAICGTFQDYDISGTANIMHPDEGANKILDSYFFYAKRPWWTWNTSAVGDDKSILDTSRIILEEGFFGFKTGYSMISQLIFFLWSCSILDNIRKLMQCLMMIIQIPGAKGDQPAGIRALREEGDIKFQITNMSFLSKVLGCSLVLWQLFMALLVGYTGFAVLRVTVCKLDLILNSLALIFVLELDDLLFIATTSKSQETFMDDLNPIKYATIFPEKYLRIHHIVMPFIGCGLCITSAVLMRVSQRQLFRWLFNAASVACLFAGSRQCPASCGIGPGCVQVGNSLKASTDLGLPEGSGFVCSDEQLAPGFYSPVPGFCESILKLSCVQPGTKASWDAIHGSCVISDYGFDFVKKVQTQPHTSVWPPSLLQTPSAGSSMWDLEWTDNEATRHLFSHAEENVCSSIHMRACLAMYHAGPTEKRVIDGSTGANSPAADFRCSQDSAIGLSKRLDHIPIVDHAPWLWHKFFGVGAHRPDLDIDLFGMPEELGKELGKCAR